MTESTISVIVPIYKVERYLDQCVRSILNQTHRNLEIILVNDGSPDGCGAVCDRYAQKDNRVRVIHQKNAGVSSARNAGLEAARGNWISFVDGDDWIEPDMLEYLLSLATRHGAELAQCGLDRGMETKNSFFRVISGSTPSMTLEDWMHFDNSNGNKLFRRDAVGEIRFRSQFAMGEDMDFNLRIVERADVIVLSSSPKYHYVQHSESACHVRPTEDRLIHYRQVLSEGLERCTNSDTERGYLMYELLRDDLHIASQTVCYGLEDRKELISTLRREIKEHRTFIRQNRYFTPKERLKFLLVSEFWPLYKTMLPRWKRSIERIRS